MTTSHPPSRRHSRRSTSSLNFTHLSVSPLTTTTLTASDFTKAKSSKAQRSSSYIAGLSAPTTPGILTPPHSHFYPPRSKSSSHLPRSTNGSSEWLHRTGALLSSASQESKGQSWLTTRASSTSLIREGEDSDAAADADDEVSTVGGGGGGGRMTALASPMWVHSEGGDYFSFAGVEEERGRKEEEEEEQEEGEEEEVMGSAYRLGQLFDRLIGWSVFEDDDSSSEEEEETKRRPREQQRIKIAAPEEQERIREEQRLRRDQDEGWQDPAWIFSIASNVLF